MNTATKAARAEVFASLQSDPVYNRLFVRKDTKVRAWVRLDARKAQLLPAELMDLKRAHAASSRAVRALGAYENAALARAGAV